MVDPADVEAVRAIAEYLQREVHAYYDTPLEGDPGAQAAFGAAAVYAAMHMNDATVTMGEVFDHPDWADRAMQHKPALFTLRNQANSAVVAASNGELAGEVLEYTDHHVGVALGDRGLALSQVDGLPAMLDGRDARDIPATYR